MAYADSQRKASQDATAYGVRYPLSPVIIIDASLTTSTSTAPAIGEGATFGQPIVEDNLIITDSETGQIYEANVDYFETPDGFENIAIPEGTVLDVEYYSDDETTLGYSREEVDALIAEAMAGIAAGLPREYVAEETTYTVAEGEQLLLYGGIQVDGDLVIEGSLVILD